MITQAFIGASAMRGIRPQGSHDPSGSPHVPGDRADLDMYTLSGTTQGPAKIKRRSENG